MGADEDIHPFRLGDRLKQTGEGGSAPPAVGEDRETLPFKAEGATLGDWN
jgi:hypothetical protein